MIETLLLILAILSLMIIFVILYQDKEIKRYKQDYKAAQKSYKLAYDTFVIARDELHIFQDFIAHKGLQMEYEHFWQEKKLKKYLEQQNELKGGEMDAS
ncbi:hypothetical protein [Paenibacillus senegalensis]|uniref:hypothetical protein n=1 Tax=Paenibacillus senegalensis TaxID=1465766 RepID=UPI00028A13F1|nr:hypothetical protein [Paenibacillus senegalensis]